MTLRSVARLSVLGLILCAVTLWLWLRSTVPDYARDLRSIDVTAPIEIIRGQHGVPHIFAQTYADAVFAAGYAQAQDRLWQMEMIRRAVLGRTAEVIGPSRFAADVEALAIYQTDKIRAKTYASLKPETKALFDRFAAGVNFAIAMDEGTSSPEWTLTGIEPPQWTGADVSNFMIAIIPDADDAKRELLKARLAKALPAEMVRGHFAPLPGDYPSLYDPYLSKSSAKKAQGSADAPPGKGTNFVVVGPERSTTGKPILAVDPHLPLNSPSELYPMALFWPGGEAVGAAWVGSPAIAFGHNGAIAWGMTHLHVDTADYIVERIDPKAPGRYVTPDGSKVFETREIEVPLKGGERKTLTVRASANGPVVSDIDGFADFSVLKEVFGPGHVAVLKQAHITRGQRSLEALLDVNQAKDWKSFRAALRRYDWTNNIAFASRSGDIGVQMAASVPLRAQKRAWTGGEMARGWRGEGSWTGFVDFEGLPFLFNPEGSVITDANSRAVDQRFEPRITDSFAQPWRVAQAHIRLAVLPKHSPASIMAIQTDVQSKAAQALIQAMSTVGGISKITQQELAALKKWDCRFTRERSEPLIYSAIALALQDRLINLHHPLLASRVPHPIRLIRILTGDTAWCDHPKTGDMETCGAAVDEAIGQAIEALERTYGRERSAWLWGDVHRAVFDATYSFASVPLLGALVRTKAETDGGTFVLASAPSLHKKQTPGALLEDLDFTQSGGATFRMIADLSALADTKFMFAPGVSGNPISPHWNNMVKAWARGDYIKINRQTAKGGQTTWIRPVR